MNCAATRRDANADECSVVAELVVGCSVLSFDEKKCTILFTARHPDHRAFYAPVANHLLEFCERRRSLR